MDNKLEEGTEDTQYEPTVTTALTPEEAARHLLDPPASAAPAEQVRARPMAETFAPGVTSRTIEGGYITETVAQDEEALPVALNADEDYQARLNDTSVTYMQTTDDEEGETVEK